MFRVQIAVLFRPRVPGGTGLEASDVFFPLPFTMGVTPLELFPFLLLTS